MALRLHSLRVHGKFPEAAGPPPVPAAPLPLKPRKESVNKVCWNESEREQLIKRTAQLREEEPELSLTQLAELAQDCLPEYRRRKIPTYKSIHPNFKEKVKASLDMMRKERVEEAVRLIEPTVQTLRVEVPARIDPHSVIGNAATPVLLAELFSRIFDRFDRLESALAREPQQNGNGHKIRMPAFPALPVPVPVTEPEKPRLPRVAVVGLFKDQFNHVQEKLSGHDLDLVWVDKDNTSPNINVSVDAVVVEHHSRHKWFDSAQKTVGNDRVFFAPGGISSVVQKCLDFLSQETARRTQQLIRTARP